jgi:hypothetical protein
VLLRAVLELTTVEKAMYDVLHNRNRAKDLDSSARNRTLVRRNETAHVNALHMDYSYRDNIITRLNLDLTLS